MIIKLVTRKKILQRFGQSMLLKNFAWVISGQFVVKISRLISTMILARQLTVTEYGYVAIIMTVTQYFHILSNSAIKQKVIQSKDEKLSDVCQTSWNLQVIVGTIAFSLQALIAIIVGSTTNNNNIVFPIALAGTAHLLNTLSYIQLALLERRRNFKVVANISNTVIVFNNLLSTVFAIGGLGYWSVSISRVIALFLQVFITFKAIDWRPTVTKKFRYWKDIVVFSIKSLGVEIMTTTRESLDYLLVGNFLGIEALGIYYFAYNAGLSITLSISKPLESIIFSEICSSNKRDKRVNAIIKCLRLSFMVITPIITLQTLLSPMYIPVVFGSKWIDAGALPVLILTCLSSTTRLPTRCILLAFRAMGRINIDFYWNAFFTMIVCIVIYVTAHINILAVALGILLAHALLEPIIIIIGLKRLVQQ